MMAPGLYGFKLFLLNKKNIDSQRPEIINSIAQTYLWKVPEINFAMCKLFETQGNLYPYATNSFHAPHRVHNCGFNAFFSYDEAERTRSKFSSFIKLYMPIMMVEGFGKIIVNERGYRAAAMRIIGYNRIDQEFLYPIIQDNIMILSEKEMKELYYTNYKWHEYYGTK